MKRCQRHHPTVYNPSPARPDVDIGRIVRVARSPGSGVLQPFKRQVSALAERPVVAQAVSKRKM